MQASKGPSRKRKGGASGKAGEEGPGRGKEHGEGSDAGGSRRGEGMRGKGYDEQVASLQPGMQGVVPQLFERLEASGEQGLPREDVIGCLEGADGREGPMGAVHDRVAERLLGELDTERDDPVTRDELESAAQKVMPSSVFDAKGRVRPEILEQSDERGSTQPLDEAEEPAREGKQRAPERAREETSARSSIAGVAAQLGVDAVELGGERERTEEPDHDREAEEESLGTLEDRGSS